MEPSRIHELNKIAGAFCGKKLTGQFSHGGERWVYASYEDECTMQYTPWNPCENHNQAAEVKATLREKFIRYSMRMIFLCSGQIFHEWELEDLDGFAHNGRDESELIALLLAVEALGKEVA